MCALLYKDAPVASLNISGEILESRNLALIGPFMSDCAALIASASREPGACAITAGHFA
jgi:hypothetical protein